MIGAVLYGGSADELAALARDLRAAGVEQALAVLEAPAAASPALDVVVNHGPRACGARQQAGLREALARGWDPILVLRPEHDLAALPALRAALDAGADLALGSRLAPGAGSALRPRRAALRAFGWALGAATGIDLREPTSGYRLARASALRRVSCDELSPGRAFDLELVLACAERGLRVVEVGAASRPSLGTVAAAAYAARALGVGARALDARVRGVLAFPGPGGRATAPVVGARRPSRPLPVVGPDGVSRDRGDPG